MKIYTDTSIVPEDYFYRDPAIKVPDKVLRYNIEKYALVDNLAAFVYITGATYPRKGIPAGELVRQVNIAKEYLKQKPNLSIINKGFFYDVDVFLSKALFSCQISTTYMCPAAIGVTTFLRNILEVFTDEERATNIAYHVGVILEIDDAYRYRVQDFFSTLDIQNFGKKPLREYIRVVRIVLSREVHPGVAKKIKRVYAIGAIALCVPFLRRKIVESVTDVYTDILFDAHDVYWAGFKDNYKFGGVSHEEHKNNNAWPQMFSTESA